MADYINGAYLKKTPYGIKFSGKADTLIEEIRKNTNEKGYFNFEIKERQQPSDKGATHYIVVDEWKGGQNG